MLLCLLCESCSNVLQRFYLGVTVYGAEPSRKTSGHRLTSRKNYHLQVASLERTNVTNICVCKAKHDEYNSNEFIDFLVHIHCYQWGSLLSFFWTNGQLKWSPTGCCCSKKDLIQGRRGSQQCFHLPRTRNSAGRRTAARKGPGPLAACGPR